MRMKNLPIPWNMPPLFLKRLRGFGCTLILEPGRVIVGNAGILVTKVLYTKENEAKKFVIVDAGMNDLVQPSFLWILPSDPSCEIGARGGHSKP